MCTKVAPNLAISSSQREKDMTLGSDVKRSNGPAARVRRHAGTAVKLYLLVNGAAFAAGFVLTLYAQLT